jgi:methionyl aminopeptidase
VADSGAAGAGRGRKKGSYEARRSGAPASPGVVPSDPRLIRAQRSSSERPRTCAIAATVGKAGVATRPDSAQSCYVDYAPSFGRGPFGHYICTAVNNAVLHGLPRDYALADGDLLTLDRPGDAAMISATERALRAGIAAAVPGARIGDLSHAIGEVLGEAGYPVNTEFGGHGIGSTMHQDPHVPNAGRPGRGYRLRPGLLLALEPWVMADTAELVTDADGWTLRSATGCRAAHSEHTIAITEDGAEILTLPRSRRT